MRTSHSQVRNFNHFSPDEIRSFLPSAPEADATHRLFQPASKAINPMETIRYLPRFGRCRPAALGVEAMAVTADDLDALMTVQPPGNAGG